MGPKKVLSASPLIKKARYPIESKKELAAKYKSGICVADLARMYRKFVSAISSIHQQVFSKGRFDGSLPPSHTVMQRLN